MARVLERRIDPFTGGVQAQLPAVSGIAQGLGQLAEGLDRAGGASRRLAEAEARRLDLQGRAFDDKAAATLEADARARLRELQAEAPAGGIGVKAAFEDWYDERRTAVLAEAPQGYDQSRLTQALDGLRLGLADQADRFERQAMVEHKVGQHKDALAARRRMVLSDPGLFDRAVEQTRGAMADLPLPDDVKAKLEREALGDLEGDRIDGLILADPRTALADLARGAAPHLDPDRRARLWHQARAAVERDDQRIALERERAAIRDGESLAETIFALGTDGPGGGGRFERFAAKVIGRESGGDPAARNTRSTAAGAFQFVEGTWQALAGKNPELGLTPAGRTGTDAASLEQQRRAFEALTAENANALERDGIVASEANLYVAHVLGAGDAADLIEAAIAAPETPVAELLSEKVVSANPELFGGSAGAETAYRRLTKGFAREGRGASLGDMLAAARRIADPMAREAAEKRVVELHSRQEKVEKEERERAAENVFDFLEQGGRIADVPDQAWLAMDRSQRQAAEGRARQLAAGIEPVTDWDVYLTLEQMPAAELAGFDLRQARPYLADGHFKQFADRQGELRRGAGDRAVDDPASLTQQIATAAKRFGLKDEEQGLFTDQAYRAVAAEQRAKGRPLDFTERQAVLDRLTLQQTTAPGWLFSTKKRGFEMALGETAELSPRQVAGQLETLASAVGMDPETTLDTVELLRSIDVKPTTETLGLAAELARRNLPLTEENLVELWSIVRGDPAPKARKPKPQVPVADEVTPESLPASIADLGPMP